MSPTKRSPVITLRLEHGDILAADVDACVFKYSNGFHGVARQAIERLTSMGRVRREMTLDEGDSVVIETEGALASTVAFFVGTGPQQKLSLNDIAKLTKISILSAADRLGTTAAVAITLHGANLGMQESDCLKAIWRGLVAALDESDYSSLPSLVLYEADPMRHRVLGRLMSNPIFGQEAGTAVPAPQDAWIAYPWKPLKENSSHQHSLVRASKIRNAFVAMPFSPGHLGDLFHFGIQEPLLQANFATHRVDREVYAGDVLERIKSLILDSTFVVGVLNGSNANVFLEIGYAWGVGKQTLLVSRRDEPLLFDVQSQNVVLYEEISEVRVKILEFCSSLQR